MAGRVFPLAGSKAAVEAGRIAAKGVGMSVLDPDASGLSVDAGKAGFPKCFKLNLSQDQFETPRNM